MDGSPEKTQLGSSSRDSIRRSYDVVTDEYVRRIYDELKDKPLDRQLLDRFGDSVRSVGAVGDVGCGPGHVARYLHERGVTVIGVDLSDVMVGAARRLNPGIEFRQGDMTALDLPDGSWAGIACFYSILHIPRDEVVGALREFRRVLRPGGLLLITFHIGSELVHRDEWWGHDVDVDFLLFEPDEMVRYLGSAGFDIEEIVQRDPYPDVEYPSRRAYIFARSRATDQEGGRP